MSRDAPSAPIRPLHAGRVLLVEDDPDNGRLVEFILTRAGYQVDHHVLPVSALHALERNRYDLLLSDVRLPGIDGLELARQAKAIDRHLPIVIMTAHASVDAAVDAVRLGVADFLRKPLLAPHLVDTVRRAIGTRPTQERVLAIGAHPDDIEIGIGATLAAHKLRGDQVTMLTLSRGVGGGDPEERAAEAELAALVLGADLLLHDLPDTLISAGHPTVQIIEETVARMDPTICYIHSVHDLHQDHRAVHQAAMVATRAVDRVFAYQAPSATVDFRPTTFITVDGQIETKLTAVGAYRSQTARVPYLAPDLLRSTARYWGRFSEGDFAEPLEVMRSRERLETDAAVVAASSSADSTHAGSSSTSSSSLVVS